MDRTLTSKGVFEPEMERRMRLFAEGQFRWPDPDSDHNCGQCAHFREGQKTVNVTQMGKCGLTAKAAEMKFTGNPMNAEAAGWAAAKSFPDKTCACPAFQMKRRRG